MGQNHHRKTAYAARRTAVLRGAGTLITLAAQRRARRQVTIREALSRDSARLGMDFRKAAQREAETVRVRKP